MRLTLLLVLVLAGCGTLALPTASEALADEVVIQTADDPDAAYRAAARGLLGAGYAMAASDAALRTFTTEFRDADRRGRGEPAPPEIRLSVVVSDTAPARVTYRGVARRGAEGSERTVLLYAGMSSSARVAWSALAEAATSSSSGAVAVPSVQDLARAGMR